MTLTQIRSAEARKKVRHQKDGYVSLVVMVMMMMMITSCFMVVCTTSDTPSGSTNESVEEFLDIVNTEETMTREVDDVIDVIQREGFEGDQKSLLFWALQASDPEKLKDMARNSVAEQEESANRRAAEVRTFAKKWLSQDSETDVMRNAVLMMRNESSTDEEIIGALATVAELVRSFDHASDFVGTIRGVPDLVRMAKSATPSISSAALAAIAAGCGNHVKFTSAVLEAEKDFAKLLVQLMIRPPATSNGELASAYEARQRRAVVAIGHLLRSQARRETKSFTDADAELVSELDAQLRGMVADAGRDARLAAAALTIQSDMLDIDDDLRHVIASATAEWAPSLVNALEAAIGQVHLDLMEKTLLAISASASYAHEYAKREFALHANEWSELRTALKRMSGMTENFEEDVRIEVVDAIKAADASVASALNSLRDEL